jgi:hypothetical protein
LLVYQIYPGTEGYLGYQELDQIGAAGRPLDRPLDRRMFLKLSYRWQLCHATAARRRQATYIGTSA